MIVPVLINDFTCANQWLYMHSSMTVPVLINDCTCPYQWLYLLKSMIVPVLINDCTCPNKWLYLDFLCPNDCYLINNCICPPMLLIYVCFCPIQYIFYMLNNCNNSHLIINTFFKLKRIKVEFPWPFSGGVGKPFHNNRPVVHDGQLKQGYT